MVPLSVVSNSEMQPTFDMFGTQRDRKIFVRVAESSDIELEVEVFPWNE